MTDELLGMPLDSAIKILADGGIVNPEITETLAPRRNADAAKGNLRVVRVLEGGARILVARFPDEVERNN